MEKTRIRSEESIDPVEPSFQTHWRPAMGWVYMVIVLFDFLFAPILWNFIEIWFFKGQPLSQWDPITLKSGGLFHIAMGAVLGVTSWQRSQERIQTIRTSFNLSENRDSERPHKRIVQNPDEDADKYISRRGNPEARS